MKSGHDVHVDDLEALLNPVHQRDLETVLEATPESRRVPVAMAWTGLTIDLWAEASGLSPTNVRRWVSMGHRMPLGAAVRLGRVLGIEPALLFASCL